jgi:hypothetical protein
MPSINRRMMLTLPPELAAALDDYKEATGAVPSTFVVQLLVECIPAIKATADAVRVVETNQAKAFDTMYDAVVSSSRANAEAQFELLEAKKRSNRKDIK